MNDMSAFKTHLKKSNSIVMTGISHTCQSNASLLKFFFYLTSLYIVTLNHILCINKHMLAQNGTKDKLRAS